jgi:RHS repeat-associated protein
MYFLPHWYFLGNTCAQNAHLVTDWSRTIKHQLLQPVPLSAPGETTHTSTNFYNGDGQRIRQDTDGLLTKYYYDYDQLLYTTDENNNKAQEHILDPTGTIIASKRFDGSFADMFFFYNYDIRGSVTSIINPDGTLVKGYTYDEFGRTHEVGNPLFQNDVKFTGAVHDQSSGLYYMNARFYNPSTGRFLTQDSYSGNPYEPWTQHLYTYGGNNPVSMIDPTGHSFTLAISTVIAGASIVAGIAAAGYTAYKSYKATGKVDWWATADAGLGTFMAVYTLGSTAYSTYTAVSMYCGVTPATTVTIGSSGSKAKVTTTPVPAKTNTNVTDKASTSTKTTAPVAGSTAANSTGGSVVGEGTSKTGTVYDNIKITQPVYEGTQIPKSFEITTANGQKMWVHPNATEHMFEYVTRNLNHSRNINSQQMLSSFESALNQSVKNGVQFDKMIKVGNWEFKFAAPRGEGLLPVVKHAQYIP